MAGPGQARFYSSTFVQTSLASGISAGATTFNVGTTSGAPGTPFIVSVDQNTSSEELMLVTNVSGLQYTVTRGVGGTSAVLHSNGASVVHVMYAQDLTDASAHIGAYDAVHGLSTGSLVVGTTDTQTLTNKTLTSPAINTPTISSPTITGTATTGPITSSGLVTAVDFKPTGLTGATAVSRYVGATASGAPASGTFAVGDYIVDQTGLIWVCTGAGTPGTWVSLVNVSGAQTLSNKTLSAPSVTGGMSLAGNLSQSSGFISASSGVIGPYFSNNGISGATQHAGWAGGTTGGAPTSGTFSLNDFIVDDTGAIWVCTAAGTPGTWLPVGTQGLPAIPVSTSTNGTATSGTTDTMDTVLGTYQFTAIAGRRYRVCLANLVCNGSVAADAFAIRVRDSGSASTPTTSSTAVLDSSWTCVVTGSGGRVTLSLFETFVASSSGTHTLAFFAQRVGGTGVFTPLSPSAVGATGVRKLWVEDAGNI